MMVEHDDLKKGQNYTQRFKNTATLPLRSALVLHFTGNTARKWCLGFSGALWSIASLSPLSQSQIRVTGTFGKK